MTKYEQQQKQKQAVKDAILFLSCIMSNLGADFTIEAMTKKGERRIFSCYEVMSELSEGFHLYDIYEEKDAEPEAKQKQEGE